MEETREKLSCIADTLYKGDTLVGMAMMTQVIEDLAKVSTMIEDEDLASRYINDGLMQALEAMESNDGTLLADVITYELIEIIDLL
ncbi:MAG: hypothetical protein E7263_02730 [Lachnospiraceae bacterium]|nr:hypothetical protein [Lachnospiraceae bacterium]